LVLELESIERSKDVRLCELLDALQGANQSLLKSEIVVKKDHRRRCPVLVTKKELVPVALVINELMVNAVKHGGGMPVVVEAKAQHDSIVLTIINHALPLPDDFDFTLGGGLGTGLGLVKSLMPTNGSELQFEYEDGRVIASLSLNKPVVAIVSECD
jgi:two-component sensor histidine kinase